MRREDFVFCIGYEGSTAIVDGALQRRHGRSSTRELAEAGLFKQAVCSAAWAGDEAALREVLDVYNGRVPVPLAGVDDLRRTFGVSVVPGGVTRVTIV